MKRSLITLASVIALSAIGAPAYAGGNAELLKVCQAYQAEHGGTADCKCLSEKAEGDTLTELLKVKSPADVETLSEASKALVSACTKE